MPPFLRLTICLCAVLIGAWPTAVRADSVPSSALVVDVQRILDESEAAKGVQKQLDSQRVRFQSETEKEENQLRQAEQDLSQSREHLGADAYTEREQLLRQRFIAEERHVDARRKALDQSFTEAMDMVRDNLMNVVQKIAHEKGANIVLVKQQILWSESTLDVTDEVLKRLNKELPQIKVKISPDDGTSK
jgi:Skp family chaperone for outer membrane proteins